MSPGGELSKKESDERYLLIRIGASHLLRRGGCHPSASLTNRLSTTTTTASCPGGVGLTSRVPGKASAVWLKHWFEHLS